MKNLFILVLALVMIVPLVGCKKEEDQTTKPVTQPLDSSGKPPTNQDLNKPL